jgi:hypothetical protein
MRQVTLATSMAIAIMSSGALSNGAKAADLYPMPEPVPPAAETPPPAAVAPPPVAVVPQAPAVVLVEPRCPVVWQCGYWGCGWRPACGPVGADFYYGGPRWGYGYGGPRWGYGGYYRPHWGHYHPNWGYHRHWSG